MSITIILNVNILVLNTVGLTTKLSQNAPKYTDILITTAIQSKSNNEKKNNIDF